MQPNHIYDITKRQFWQALFYGRLSLWARRGNFKKDRKICKLNNNSTCENQG